MNDMLDKKNEQQLRIADIVSKYSLGESTESKLARMIELKYKLMNDALSDIEANEYDSLKVWFDCELIR